MRVRFAPSPTGALHIGGARTALYNWLTARHEGDGRHVAAAHRGHRPRALDAGERPSRSSTRCDWLELDCDEGPIFQTERAPRHAEVLEQLLDAGHAYRTNATADDVKAYKDEHGADRGFRGTRRGRARSACASPTRARPWSTTSSAATRSSATSTSTIR